MTEHMHDGFPEHIYDYIKKNCSTFFTQLHKQLYE